MHNKHKIRWIRGKIDYDQFKVTFSWIYDSSQTNADWFLRYKLCDHQTQSLFNEVQRNAISFHSISLTSADSILRYDVIFLR